MYKGDVCWLYSPAISGSECNNLPLGYDCLQHKQIQASFAPYFYCLEISSWRMFTCLFPIFFFILCFGCSQTQFFLIYTLFPTQMSSPSISASLAPEFGEQPTPSQEPVWDMTSFQVVIKSKCVFCIQHQHGELVLSLALWPVPQSPRSILPCKHSTSDPRVWVTSHCLCDISPSGGMVGLNGLNFIVLAASQG